MNTTETQSGSSLDPLVLPDEQVMDALDSSTLLSEHRDTVRLLSRCVDVMRVTERLFQLKAGHLLMTTCADVEHWLDEHQ
jgi:hypothetical protein